MAELLVVPGAALRAGDARPRGAEGDAAPGARVVAPLPLVAVLVALAPDLHALLHGVALEAGGTDAARAVVVHLAGGAEAADGTHAGVYALVALAGLVQRAVGVRDALICPEAKKEWLQAH